MIKNGAHVIQNGAEHVNHHAKLLGSVDISPEPNQGRNKANKTHIISGHFFIP